MSTADSLLAVAVGETTSRPSPIEEANLHLSLNEGLLIEPNRDTVNQTQMIPVNGGSRTFGLRPPQPLFPPRLRPAQEYFNAVQKWEGYVIEVGQDTFRARLVPIIGEGPDQEAEIYLREMKEEDHTLIKPGAVFYWSIGYLDRPSGRLRASVIRFGCVSNE